MPLYYCVLLTIFKDLTTRGNLLAIVGGAPFEHTSGISIWGKTQTSSLALYEGQKNGIIRVFCCLFLL